MGGPHEGVSSGVKGVDRCVACRDRQHGSQIGYGVVGVCEAGNCRGWDFSTTLMPWREIAYYGCAAWLKKGTEAAGCGRATSG